MRTLILLTLLGFVLAFSLAIPFNGDTAEAYDAESNDLARDFQGEGNEGYEKNVACLPVSDSFPKKIIAYQ